MRTPFVHSWMGLALPIAVVAAAAVACSDATGSLEGGEALTLPTVGDSGTSGTTGASGTSGTSGTSAGEAGMAACPPSGTPTFSQLYPCYFTACGVAGCHGTAIDDGSVTSGFVCGTTASSCAMGMTSTLMTSMQPIVPPGGAQDATKTGLYAALNKGGAIGQSSNNMPLAPTTVFSTADMSAIDAWIQAGAQNN